jgi:hypothetical protein
MHGQGFLLLNRAVRDWPENVRIDIVTLASSTWVVALAFVSPTLAARLTPFHSDSTIWLGTLSAITFFLTLVQLKTDWKSRGDAHARL